MAAETKGIGGGQFVLRDSHRALLASVSPSPLVHPPVMNGIVVVPGTRGVHHLSNAVSIAMDLRWPMLVLCSKGMRAPRVRDLLRGLPSLRLVAVDFPADLRTPGPSAAREHPAAVQRSSIDTDRKRNIAVATAAMTGRDCILFLDDDIFAITPADVRRAMAHLQTTPTHTVVGWPSTRFADNSVVYHMRREVLRLPQDCFIGGNALLVRLAGGVPPPFPPIYNEDWLFLFDFLAGREVAVGQEIGQEPYDPYEDPERARLEEFGDLLAEGLYHLLHERASISVALTPDYWASVRARRAALIDQIMAELRVSSFDPPHPEFPRERALESALASRAQLTRVTPQALVDFVQLWRRDQQLWTDFCSGLPRRERIKDCLVHLGIHEARILESRAAA